MVNLEKEFKKVSERDSQMNPPLEEIRLLLEGDRQHDINIMRHLAGSSAMIANEVILGKKLELEKLDKKYGKVFTIQQIEELALKYRLRFLKSNLFIGNMDIQAIAKLKEFAKDSDLSIMDEATLRYNFFILAPHQQFDLLRESLAKTNRETEREIQRRKDEDPVLFYKIDDVHYRMIHQWGHDFSPIRRIEGWIWKDSKNYFMAQYILVTIVTLLLLVGYYQLVDYYGYIAKYPIVHTLLMLLGGFFTFYSTWLVRESRVIKKGKYGRDDSKIHQPLFTKNNWRDTTVWTVK